MILIELTVAVASMLLVYFTLLEMQVERNNAYLPDIYFNETEFIVTLDINGLALSEHPDDEIFQTFAESTKNIDKISRVELINIGMGTAKNMRVLTDYLYAINSYASFTVISSHGHKIQTIARPYLEITYMQNQELR